MTPTAVTGIVVVGAYVFRLRLRPDDLAAQFLEPDDHWYVERESMLTKCSRFYSPPDHCLGFGTRCDVFPLSRTVHALCACGVDATTIAVGSASGAVVVAHMTAAGMLETTELVEVRPTPPCRPAPPSRPTPPCRPAPASRPTPASRLTPRALCPRPARPPVPHTHSLSSSLSLPL